MHRRWDVGAVALGCNRITSSRPRCIRSNLVAVGSDKLSPRCILAGDLRRRWKRVVDGYPRRANALGNRDEDGDETVRDRRKCHRDRQISREKMRQKGGQCWETYDISAVNCAGTRDVTFHASLLFTRESSVKWKQISSEQHTIFPSSCTLAVVQYLLSCRNVSLSLFFLVNSVFYIHVVL